MSADAERALIVTFPPGDALLRSWAILAGGQNQVGLSFLPRGHRPLQCRNLKAFALYEYRLAWHNRGRGRFHSEGKRSFPQSFFAYFFLEKSRLLQEVYTLDLDTAVLVRVDGEAASIDLAGTLRLLIAPGQTAQKQVDGVLRADT